jgi:acyl-CoA oxidase
MESAKWWIGGLGVVATHALVQASLFINSKLYGPHLFIVPVRSPVDMSPLPNVQVGEIGSKAFGGFASIDNGYARFNKVRIPRQNMLQRYAQVSSEGIYTHAKQERMSYGSMVTLRVAVVNNEAWNLARALTIAVRYTNVRRQFSANGGKKEDQVITYSSVKYRLFPLLGVCFAYIFAAKGLIGAYIQMLSELNTQGESSLLAEVHALSSGLKPCSTWDCLAGVEECRKACGGHGFSAYAGIGHIWANGVASQTYEGAIPRQPILLTLGDNYVISQQTARACLKYLQNPTSLPPTAEYFGQPRASVIEISSAANWKDETVQLEVLQARARKAVMTLAALLQQGTPWKDLNMDCVAVSRAHVEVFVLRTFVSTIASLTDPVLKSVLTKLQNLVLCLL